MASRKQYSSEQKARIVLETMNERHTIRDLAQKYKVHPQLITNWRKQFLESASVVFERGTHTTSENRDGEVSQLYEKIGQLQVELDYLKKSSKALHLR